jgi:hypothetical protein
VCGGFGRERDLIEMDLIGPAGTSTDSGDTSARRAAHHRIDQRGLGREGKSEGGAVHC